MNDQSRHPVTTGLALVGSIAFLAGAAGSDPTHALIALGVLVASVPVFWLVQR